MENSLKRLELTMDGTLVSHSVVLPLPLTVIAVSGELFLFFASIRLVRN